MRPRLFVHSIPCRCLLLVALVGCQSEPGGEHSDRATESVQWQPYTGRYALNPDLVLDVKADDGLLTLLPSFWRTALILDSTSTDRFGSRLHPDFEFQFIRDSTERIGAVVVTGNEQINGRARRLADDEYLAVELLLAGDGRSALTKLDSEGLTDPQRAINLGFGLIANFPSRAAAGATFLSGLESRFPGSADLREALGHAWMLAGDRDRAAIAFRNTALVDPDNRFALRALRHLDPQNATPPPADAWDLPFDLDSLFAAPTAHEIEAVRDDWERRHLGLTNVQRVAEHAISLQGRRFVARILSHSVHGDLHYGAVLIPDGATAGCCPVVVELHGVDADYSPFDIERARIPSILRHDLSRVIVALPAFRGNTLVVTDHSYESQGTPTGAWDGAADDAIAFLNVVLDEVPEADSSKVCAYGKSRGGTVALLVGERDTRIDCVVNWAGPAEWFRHMGTFGWTLREQVEWALWERWEPGRGWGSSDQFIDWFLRQSIPNGVPGLKETRHAILASSPLYFLDTLPAAEMHYGTEDRSVPAANAEALRRALAAQTTTGVPVSIHIHDGAGHDMPYPIAHETTHAFLAHHLFQD